jgi:hypothetical protein
VSLSEMAKSTWIPLKSLELQIGKHQLIKDKSSLSLVFVTSIDDSFKAILESLVHSLNSLEMNHGYGVLTNKTPLIESKLLSQLLRFLPSLPMMTHFVLKPMLPSSLSVLFFLSDRMIHGNRSLTSLKHLTRWNTIMGSMIEKCLQS